MSLYLSRLTLRRDPGTKALRSLIDPAERGHALDAHHRLIWTAFADTPARERDFLWRADGQGRFLVLSARPPAEAPLFETPEVKSFAPALAPGDGLAFELRVNATKTRPEAHRRVDSAGRKRDGRVDVVMHTLYALPGRGGDGSSRQEARMRLAREAGRAWMDMQGARSGFAVQELVVEDYAVLAVPGRAGPRRGQAQFGVLDLAGTLTVTDPAVFLARLAAGFGRAKAFGCGLMLLRRAAPTSDAS